MAYVYGTNNSETLNALDGVTSAADRIFAYGGNDIVYGLGGNDEVYGMDGNDTIVGGAGADLINGGNGIDTASYTDSGAGVYVDLRFGTGEKGTAEGDTLVSIENLTGSAHRDLLIGNDGANVLSGLGEYDRIYGFGGNDIISGGPEGDHLYGGDGNDIMRGDAGPDGLRGDAGADRFVWTSTEESGVDVRTTADSISDFNLAEDDRIDLAAIDADVFAAGNQAFTFIGAAGFSGTPGEINYIYTPVTHASGDTVIQLQTGVDADVEAVIWLPGIHVPEASWFVL